MCVAPVPLKNETAKFKANKPFTDQKSNITLVPCGKCIDCRKTYINGWIFRLNQQFKSKSTNSAFFLTLTYDDSYLLCPEEGLITDDGELTLNYRHHQLYMKRLRKLLPHNDIKYFTVGEYGDRTGRPHYHSIIFNADQQSILDAWDYGNVHFGEVNEKTMAYTLKYALKKVGRVTKSDWKNPDATREIERTLISKGIGKDYLTDDIKKYYQDDITRQIRKESGTILALPRYYREKIYSEGQQIARGRISQKEFAKKFSIENISNRNALAKKDAAYQEKKEAFRKANGD